MTDPSAGKPKTTTDDTSSRVDSHLLVLRASSGLGKAVEVGAKAAVRTWGVTKSTGARIALLHGAAQERAVQAVFGFGAKSVGGAGMAGGARTLAVVRFAPVALGVGAIVAHEVYAARRDRDRARWIPEPVQDAPDPEIEPLQ